jgi:two-component system response regulator HydG
MSKPLDITVLEHALDRALGERHLREQVRRLEQAKVPPIESVGAFVGKSRVMRSVYDLIRRIAPSSTTTVISGESGTGKELVARALHELSGVPGKFVAINCAAMPGELLESELFGHVRGAFTDAKLDRAGLLEQAAHGTLLLDEIGELPLDMQPKLLRVLQERTVRRIGGNESVPVTARIITATNRDLEEEVEAKRFREDLFYRLNVVQIHIPPLRARGSDILLLAEHFIKKFASRSGKGVASISAEAQRKLATYDWPGNVRQLENAIESAIAITHGTELQLSDFPDRIQQSTGNRADSLEVDLEYTLTLDQLERRQIESAIHRFEGNKTRAAKALGVDRRTLYRKLERYQAPPNLGGNSDPSPD